MSGDRNWLYTDTFAGHTQYAVCDDDRDWGVSEGAGGKPFTDIHMTTTLAPHPSVLTHQTHKRCIGLPICCVLHPSTWGDSMPDLRYFMQSNCIIIFILAHAVGPLR